MNTAFKSHESTEPQTLKAWGYAAQTSSSRLAPFEFERAAAGEGEVEIDVLFCGVCHSDIHQVKNEWSNSVYPCLPGHEIVGRVRKLGPGATRHAVGDLVGVGCMIDSCGDCAPCRAGDQNYCESPNGFLATYNGPMVAASKAPAKKNIYGRDNTFGGYSNCIVVREDFVLKIPAALKPEVAAPILCAGVTTYSPMKHWGVKPGDRVGIIGFGGLGDMAAKIARALGAKVSVFTRTREKLAEAGRLGLDAVLETDEQTMEALASSFDFILSTVPEKHDMAPFVKLLKRDRTACVVGCLGPLDPIDNTLTAMHRKSIAGSLIGNLEETQEILHFCAKHQVFPDIQIIEAADLNSAYEKVEKGEVRFRFVIDMGSLRRPQSASADSDAR